MAPEVLSLQLFEGVDLLEGLELTTTDIVNRFCSADIYSFSLIAWLVMSHCKEIYTEMPTTSGSIDDFLFHEFLELASQEAKDQAARNKTIEEKEQLMNRLINKGIHYKIR